MATFDDDDEAGLADREFPDESDMDEDDELSTDTCPNCKRAVYEDAEQCPNCGEYLLREPGDSPKSKRLVIGTFVCLGILLLAWLFSK